MKPLILVVDDTEFYRVSIKRDLESIDYEVVTADNGAQALTLISILDRLPDVIISDIIMPEMNGYDFFKTVCNNPLWNSIPFLFLSACSNPEEILIGKLLGVDDYLTKPFKTEELIGTVAGKIVRIQKINSINNNIIEMISAQKHDYNIPFSELENQIFLILVEWDDRIGPEIIISYPKTTDSLYSIRDVGVQLFQSTQSIYGQEKITKAGGLLLNIENIKRRGYIYFDSYPDPQCRSREREYMLGLIAPLINYLDSLRIKKLFEKSSKEIKEKKEWDIRKDWKKVVKILTTEKLDFF